MECVEFKVKVPKISRRVSYLILGIFLMIISGIAAMKTDVQNNPVTLFPVWLGFLSFITGVGGVVTAIIALVNDDL